MFIDEADAFLRRGRANDSMSEDTRSCGGFAAPVARAPGVGHVQASAVDIPWRLLQEQNKIGQEMHSKYLASLTTKGSGGGKAKGKA